MSAQRFTFKLADGRTITGVVQGSGGLVQHLQRVKFAVAQASRGRDTSFYEPKKGYVRVYPHYSSSSSGAHVDIPLAGALVSIAK